jgi:hypothetical protein
VLRHSSRGEHYPSCRDACSNQPWRQRLEPCRSDSQRPYPWSGLFWWEWQGNLRGAQRHLQAFWRYLQDSMDCVPAPQAKGRGSSMPPLPQLCVHCKGEACGDRALVTCREQLSKFLDRCSLETERGSLPDGLSLAVASFFCRPMRGRYNESPGEKSASSALQKHRPAT